jgi:3-dehydroquinate synthase
LENLSKGKIKHGEAVALGMCVAARISETMNLMKGEEVTRQRKLLKDIGFNLSPPPIKADLILHVMHHDKKAEAGVIKFVLPTGIGSAPILKCVDEGDIMDALEVEGYA